MKSIFLATSRNRFGVFEYGKVLFLFLLMSACFASSLPAGQVGQPSPVDNINSPVLQGIRNGVMTSGDACPTRNDVMTSKDACPTREELISKTSTLQMPFIANNGQVDEQVQFYAKTFGGTVFVTKEGEIVYSLPEGRGRDVPAGASPSPSPSQQAHGDALGSIGVGERRSMGAEEQGRKAVFGWHGQAPCVANIYSPFLRADNADCPPDRVIANALLAAYLPGLQKETTQRVVSTPATSNPGVLPANNNPHSKIQNPQSPLRGVALKETILGAKMGGVTGEQPAVTTVSYFKGNDESKWKTNVPTYNLVNLGEVYKGIELSLKAYGNNVEKLFCVKPGASPEFIKVQLDGSKSLRINQEGQLEADTELGLVKFTRPIAYQEIDGKRVAVACKYTIAECGVRSAEYKTNPQSTTSDSQNSQSEFRTPHSTNSNSPIPHSEFRTPHSEYSFTVASYDKTKDPIIDPLLASTFLGGSYPDCGNALALDTSGNVYVTGFTLSSDFPTTIWPYDTSYNGGYGDVFVSKLNSGLTSLLASTFLGGSGDDEGYSITLDTSGNVYVTGYTRSSNFPTTSGAYDTSFNGSEEVFVSKLNSGLTSLLASTYLGGSGGDVGNALALDAIGNVCVTGVTYSSDFPTTSGAYDTSYNGGGDVFVSVLTSGLTRLPFSTYLGGDEKDFGCSLTIDASGDVYVTGKTMSTDFPTTSGAYDTSFNGGSDVFVSKLNFTLGILRASTFLGEDGGDTGYSLALDTSGNVYVAGLTGSVEFPVTSGAYDTFYNGGSDVFVSKLNSGLTSLLASTFLGGDFGDTGCSLALDTSGNVYVAGLTGSTGFPVTSGAYDTTFNGSEEVFVSKLNSGLTSLLASTYLGGSDYDGGYSLTLDTSGNVYVTGSTLSSDFPTMSGAFDTSYNGTGNDYAYGLLYGDVFVSKLDGNLSAADTTPPTVVSTSPGNNAVGVALDSVITAVFSEEMDASTINTATFYLNGGVTGTVSYDKTTNTAKFTPYSNLSNAITYTATITTGVKDVAGNSMAANYTWSFTTVSGLCKATSITAAPTQLALTKNGNGNVTITVKGNSDCLVEGATVTATINGVGSQRISISPSSQKTNANGQAVFTINAKDQKGKATIKFKASGLSKSATVKVTVK